jgi:hypothetical protein
MSSNSKFVAKKRICKAPAKSVKSQARAALRRMLATAKREPPTKTVFFVNVPICAGIKQKLRGIFEQFGAVVALEVYWDNDLTEIFGGGGGKAWGVVDFSAPVGRTVKVCLDGLHGVELIAASTERSEERLRQRMGETTEAEEADLDGGKEADVDEEKARRDEREVAEARREEEMRQQDLLRRLSGDDVSHKEGYCSNIEQEDFNGPEEDASVDADVFHVVGDWDPSIAAFMGLDNSDRPLIVVSQVPLEKPRRNYPSHGYHGYVRAI